MGKGPLSPRQIGRLSRACLNNAGRLIDDAELLLSHRRYASASTCALFALEEFGKHMWCTSASGFDPDDAETWRSFWKVWRAHPSKLAFGAGQLIDVRVNQLDAPDERADEIWRDAYADLRARLDEISRWRTGTMYVDWRAEEVDLPSERFGERFAQGLVADVRLVVDSAVAMWSDVDLEERMELLAPRMRRLRDEVAAALEAGDEQRFFAIFEDLVRPTQPPGPELQHMLARYRQSRERGR